MHPKSSAKEQRKPCLVCRAVYKQFKQSLSSWACKAQWLQFCIDEKWKKKQNHTCPHQNKSSPEANSEAGKAKVHFKVNSGVAQCVNLMKHTGKSQYMSHSHQSIKTLWESTAITLWAKWLSKEIPLKASHRGLLWSSMFCSSFLLCISFFLSCIFFIASALDFTWFYPSCCFAFLLDLSHFYSFFFSPPLFCSLFFPSSLPWASVQYEQRMES